MSDVGEGGIFFYIMLTLVFLFTILALVIAIIAYVKATNQNVGPEGPEGPPGPVNTATFFEQPAFYVSDLTYVVSPDVTTQPRFLVFNGNPTTPPFQIQVTMPDAGIYNGKIFRIYNVQAPGGVLLGAAAGNPPIVPAVFNPILPGYFALAISDGTEFVLNSSTVVTVITGP